MPRFPKPSPFALVLLVCLCLGGAFVWWTAPEPDRFLAAREAAWHTRIAAGDIVFQDLNCGPRCALIREVTRSRYSHVGIVLEDHGERVVWEAFHPVGPTPLAEWVSRGIDRRFAVYRLKDSTQLPAVAREVRAMHGLPYDGDYQWDDERIYCSELIAKAFLRATGRPLFAPHPLGPGAFGDRASLIAQMSKGRLTEQTPLVSPLDITRSPELVKVFDELEAPSDGNGSR